MDEARDYFNSTQNDKEFKKYKKNLVKKGKFTLDREFAPIKKKYFKDIILLADIWNKQLKRQINSIYNYKASKELYSKDKKHKEEHEVQKRRKYNFIKK